MPAVSTPVASQGSRTSTTQWFDAISVVSIVILFSGVIAFDINIKREISQVDLKIAEVTKNNDNLRSRVKNKRKEQEALKTTKVAEFARLHKMCIPSQGLYVQVNTRTPSVMGAEQETMIAMRKAANHSNIATISHTAANGAPAAQRE